MDKTSAPSHIELVERCKINDRVAQQELYELYARPMFNVCYRIVNQQEEAEDVLQEAFIRMFRQIEGFRKESSFGAWFKRIVVNGALNYVKRKKKVVNLYENIADEDFEELVDDEVNSAINYSADHVQNAMELMPEGYRIVFSLYLFEEYSHKMIAEELGITESTSKSQLNRAKKKIREILKQQVNEKVE